VDLKIVVENSIMMVGVRSVADGVFSFVSFILGG